MWQGTGYEGGEGDGALGPKGEKGKEAIPETKPHSQHAAAKHSRPRTIALGGLDRETHRLCPFSLLLMMWNNGNAQTSLVGMQNVVRTLWEMPQQIFTKLMIPLVRSHTSCS